MSGDGRDYIAAVGVCLVFSRLFLERADQEPSEGFETLRLVEIGQDLTPASFAQLQARTRLPRDPRVA